EPRLPRAAVNDLELPDCAVGFYDSLVVFDHALGKTWIVSTGLAADGSRSEARALAQAEFWRAHLSSSPEALAHILSSGPVSSAELPSSLSRGQFMEA